MVIVLVVSGFILWWPRNGHWLRRMTVRRGVRGVKLLHDLHNTLGFWLAAPLLLWATTGVYFAFPNLVNSMIDASVDAGVGSLLAAENLVAAIVRLHFGRVYGTGLMVAWTVAGLLPVGLAVTGLMMWWRRVGRKWI